MTTAKPSAGELADALDALAGTRSDYEAKVMVDAADLLRSLQVGAGFNEAEGHAASLRQQASWIEESPAAEMIDADELRAAADFIERRASQPGVRERLEQVEAALEQAQDCIRGETPEDISDQEAREDTISKIREALENVAILFALIEQPMIGKYRADYSKLTPEKIAQDDPELADLYANSRPVPGVEREKIARIIAPHFSGSAFDALGNWLDRQVMANALDAADAILALIEQPARDELIASLQYEVGMYRSLYEAALSSRERNTLGGENR